MTTIADNLSARISAVVEHPTLTVVPVGNGDDLERGILYVAGEKWAGLRRAVTQAFGVAIVAAALAAAPQVHAKGVGYDADIYGQGGGQVMQQGSAVRMQVESVRQVQIELPAQAPRYNGMVGTAVTVAAGGLGAVVGSRVGGNSDAGRQVATILGGLVGALAGGYANEVVNAPQESKQIPATEITMLNPATNQIAVVTQAGEQHFARGDKVLVISSGGSARVVPDLGHERQAVDRAEVAPAHGVLPRNAVSEIVRSAGTMGIQVDPAKVANLLETGRAPNQMYVGRVVGLDKELGLVYQDLGRGVGTVHLVDSLSKTPVLGEPVTIRYKDGLGLVTGRPAGRSLGR